MISTFEKPRFDVADIARMHGLELINRGTVSAHQKKVMTALCNCRTAELGGHKEVCTNSLCALDRYAYNGCRDRHCPKCNGMKRQKWVADRKADALPVPYFHIVFTLPDSLESLCIKHGPDMYNLMFTSAWQTIGVFARQHKYLGAEMGMVAVLHTWGQNLMRHTHIHCLVPAGGVDTQGWWRFCKQEGKFFVHVKQLSKVYRGKFTDGLIKLQQKGIIELPVEPMIPAEKYKHPLYKTKWVVYVKKPLPSSDHVVEYIGRYSHRIAISNHRIKAFADEKVSFSWLDYRTSKLGVMTLDATDFMQRFLTHVLPVGFMKIRHYGILASRNKAKCIAAIRVQFDVAPIAKPLKRLNWMETFELLYGRHPKLCPYCGKGIMVAVLTIIPAYRLRQRDGPQMEANIGFFELKA